MQINNIDFKPISKACGLYIVATPIGNLADITIRALQVLGAADVIYSEDTRQTKKLLQHYGINSWLEIYNDHNASQARPKILADLAAGKMVALVTDAGTPLISDPGFKLVRDCTDAGHKIIPIPGACAAIAGLVGSTMASDQFHFAGFVDDKKFTQLGAINSTIIFYESPNRLAATLAKMSSAFAGRTACVARELTKIYEEFKIGTFEQLHSHYTQNPAKGEVVIIISPPSEVKLGLEDIEGELKQLLKTHKLKEAAEIIATKYNISKKTVYEHGIKIKS